MAARRFNVRSLTTLILAAASLVLAASGCVLFAAPRGWLARSTDWAVLWINREQWAALHAVMALTVLIFATVHVWYNWKPLVHYIEERVREHVRLRWEPFIALGLVAIIVTGTLLGWMPFRAVADMHDWVKGQWELSAPEGSQGGGGSPGGGHGRRQRW